MEQNSIKYRIIVQSKKKETPVNLKHLEESLSKNGFSVDSPLEALQQGPGAVKIYDPNEGLIGKVCKIFGEPYFSLFVNKDSRELNQFAKNYKPISK